MRLYRSTVDRFSFITDPVSSVSLTKHLGQLFSVCCNDLFVPIEGFFLGTIHRAVAFVIKVNINKAIAFAHFAC